MERIDNLLLKLKEYSITHPNLTNMWCKYIETRVLQLENTINQGEKMLENMASLTRANSSEKWLSIHSQWCVCSSV